MSRQSEDKKEIEFLQKKLALLEQKNKIEKGLPHLHAFKWYPWARKVFESQDKEIFLVAANQLSKSSTAIRKNIHLATEPKLWPEFWPQLNGRIPNLFWYFYPTASNATTEFETKWMQFLPQGEFKNHPQYGWEAEWEKGFIHSIRFNSGVMIQFKSYSMKVKDLQSSSVYHMTCDEELPIHLLSELKSRLNATEGYFLMVFTATLGQLYWQQAMEPSTKAEEKHPDALKLQVSLYDSQFYEDGSASPWTAKKIQQAIANCPTEAEIQRRVMGRFIKSQGLLYEAFSIADNMVDAHPLPKSWLIYSAVDVGSGGQSGHPAAIVFIAVSPDYKQGRIFKAWRGDGIPTTAEDILTKHSELRGHMALVCQSYDWASKDFFTIASRKGESFIPADKGKEAGVGVLNTLFKNKMLMLQRGDPEIDKLVNELCSLGVNADKKKASDDLCFSGGTFVETNRGAVPIENIKLGDLALTRNGYKRILAITTSLASTVCVNFRGEVTWVTPNHSYITTKGLIAAKSLGQGVFCLGLSESERQKFSSSREQGSEDIPSREKDTFGFISLPLAIQNLAVSILKFIKNLMVKSREVLPFIILIIIQSTIIQTILRRLRAESICLDICENPTKIAMSTRRPLNLPEGLRPNGIETALWVRTFINGLPRRAGSEGFMLKIYAAVVAKSLKSFAKRRVDQDFAQTIANQSGAEIRVSIISRKFVLSAEKIFPQANIQETGLALESVEGKVDLSRSRLGRVYNITVEGEHEYFANGILVANCDALRYAAKSIPWDFSGIEGANIIDELKKEALPIKERTIEDERRDYVLGISPDGQKSESVEDELAFWNEMCGGYDERF